jgi:outer membrane protein assembly factor BamA
MMVAARASARSAGEVAATAAGGPAGRPLRLGGAGVCLLWLLGVGLLAGGCAEIQPTRYGIDDIRFKGMNDLDSEALRVCLASQPREKVTLGLAALRKPECGVPPFDKPRFSKRLFAWGWTEWPIYDEAILKLDMERVTRWYRARGYYDAQVKDIWFDPKQAKKSDENPKCSEEGCKLDITIVVHEGEPIVFREAKLFGIEQLNPQLQRELRETFRMKKGSVFDESKYDEAKSELEKLLREQGYARAKIYGEVVIARDAKLADIWMTVDPGPRCRIGKVRVQSQEPVPTGPILATTLLHSGTVYRESDLDDAQRSVYALGTFTAVNVRPDFETSAPDVIDIVIEVEPRRKSQVQLGAGIMSGLLATGRAAQEQISVPQWDVHLIGSYEHRNFMGGLRRFRIEDRPRMLFLAPFPKRPENSPRFGNLIAVQFSQPGVFEPRTTLFVEANSDYGPDPFQLFFRNDIGMVIGLERGFWKQRIKIRGAIHQELMFVTDKKRQAILKAQRYPDDTKLMDASGRPLAGELRYPDISAAERNALQFPMCRDIYEDKTESNEEYPLCRRTLDDVLPSSYRLPFLEQRVTMDLRDDAQNPTKGGYFSLSIHEAVKIEKHSWNYVRLMPDVRGYVPIGLGMVLAARFMLGAIYILDADKELDYQARYNGPQAYRLRGGGAQSNRGFLPGQLGDSRVGGTRQWESSVEWRIPLADSFSIVGFGDIGDVDGCPSDPSTVEPPRDEKCKTRFRFERLNTSFGGGLRYRTIVGPIRLDVGYRPKNLQRSNGSPGEEDTLNLGKAKFRGAVHLTIGEAF